MATDDPLLARQRTRLARLLADDAEVRRARPSLEAIASIRAKPTTIESLATAFERYADRSAFGARAPGGSYRLIRYADVWARVEAFASGLAHEGLADAGTFVGICGFGSVDWVVADLACIHLAAVSVPLQTGLSPIDFETLVNEARLRCIVCSEEQWPSIEEVLPDCPSVESLVVMGDGGATGARSMAEIERRGRAGGIRPFVLPSARGERDPLMTLYYSSGSTGLPKAAMYRESLLHAQWRGSILDASLADVPSITLGYMPLNHGAGRGEILATLLRGGTTYFVAKSDMSTLFDDARLARPTTMLLVPRVSGAIHQRFQTELVRRSRVARGDAPIERELLVEMRDAVLGDRLLQLTTASAPTPPAVRAFLERCFEVPVHDLYGSIEAGLVALDGRRPADLGVEWKIADVPELGYRTTDRPYPRGEMRVRSPFTIPGYFGDESGTKDLFDDEGFLRTGDIVERRGPDSVTWLDRAKSVLKLAQGEFVAPARLEGIYASRSPLVRQVYVHGDAFHAYLLAVIVPDLEASGGATDDATLKPLLRAELDRVAREAKLGHLDVPRDFLIEREPFSVEKGLLTDSQKPARPRLEARYRTRLDAMYAAIERAQIEEAYALEGPLARAPVAEKVRKAIGVELGLADLAETAIDQSFVHLGGDSLGAAGLAALIHDVTGVDVPVGFLLDSTSSVRSVIAYVERAVEGRGRHEPTAAELHGEGATVIGADEVQIEKVLRDDDGERARAATRSGPARAEVALLTGADGFLGRFLLLELLERLGGAKKVYALVRAPSDAAARERLAAAYRTDPRLAARFEALAGDVTVLAGDLIMPGLGLADDVHARLAQEVDLIVHNAALVNHALHYEQVFEPNVMGTVRVMRLALERRRKSYVYVSTLGVLGSVERAEPIREDEDLRALVPERPFASGYAPGYLTSKWVCELLARDAHEKLGLPATVFRSCDLLAHSEYLGQVNVSDFFTRLLAGIVYTGLAPKSFYAPGASDHVRHFDGLPVDVVARSIVAPSVLREPRAPFRTHHVTNPHARDGVSLDVIVDWTKAAGYPIERVLDYDEWFRKFHDRLASLPEAARQRSPLAIVEAWSRRAGERAQPAIDGSRLLARLRAIDPALAALPHVTEALIDRMLDDMALLGVIEPPGPRARRRAIRASPSSAAPAVVVPIGERSADLPHRRASHRAVAAPSAGRRSRR